MRPLVAGLLVVLVSGCASSSTFDPATQFLDADQRWADHLSVGAEVDYDASILAGPAVWHLSADSPEGFEVQVYGRNGLMDGNLGFDHWGLRVQGLHWRPFEPGYTGEATVSVECGGPCGYAVARDENGTLPALNGIEYRYRDADARFVGTLDDDFGSHDFELPDGVRSLRMRISAHAPDDWFRMTLTDSEGEAFKFLRFPAVTLDDLDAMTLVGQDDDEDDLLLPSGTWNLLVTCDGACDYNYGFYW